VSGDDSLRVEVTRTAAGVVVVAIGLGLLLSAGELTWRNFAVSSAVSMLYGATIAIPAVLVFRRLRPRLIVRPELQQWLVYAGVMLVAIAVGTLASGVVLVALGVTPADETWDRYLVGLQISFAIAVPMAAGAATFTRLHRRLDATERETDRARQLATDARLASLESRVRPHFLFNALNSAIALIPEDPRRAEEVLERLAGLLRYSLDDAARLVALGDELRMVRDYLEIERVRFGDRLAYRIDAPAELAALRVPAFALQTLVENSVKYAVAPRTAGATIVVRARRDGAQLVLEILDDGPGFTGAMWVPGHGLDSLRARLDALYGDAARLAPRTRDGGAEVVLALPVEVAA
jgi:signal transduction histidine kinase